jgi:hypothetical protein
MRLRARRIATRLSIEPYSQEIEEFVQEDSISREAHIYSQLVSLNHKLDLLTASSQSYTVDRALMVSRFVLLYLVCISDKWYLPRIGEHQELFTGNSPLANPHLVQR